MGRRRRDGSRRDRKSVENHERPEDLRPVEAPWPDADRLPPTPRQVNRIETLCAELGKPVARAPQNQMEAYDWIGRFGAAVAKQRNGETKP